MADELIPQLPPDEPSSWLARNRKLVILGGLAILLGGAAAVTFYLPRRSEKVTNTSNQTNSRAAANTPTNSYDRPTFQRSTVPDVPTTLPPTYQPPTNADLRHAIDQLHTNTTH